MSRIPAVSGSAGFTIDQRYRFQKIMAQKLFIDPFLDPNGVPDDQVVPDENVVPECEQSKNKRTLQSLKIRPNEYDLIFHPLPGYDQKTRRSDRTSDAVIKQRIYEQERERDIPLTSSHVHGHR